ncbi:TPA: hypothetical protein DCX16_01830 [bacterium]|nr:hypothetical protein [bacterium]
MKILVVRMIFFSGLFFILLPTIVLGEYKEVLENIFFSRYPSAKVEALGKGCVAIDGDIATCIHNPSGIASIEKIIFGTSYSKSYYSLEDAEYNFFGVGFPIKRGAIGLSRYHFDYRNPILFSRIEDGAIILIGEFDSDTSLFTLTFAYESSKDLFVGINGNVIRQRLGIGIIEPDYAGFGDIGVLKSFEFQENSINQKICLGASLSNFTSSKIHGDDLPVILRLGFSYKTVLKPIIALLLHIELQDVLNSRYRGGFKVGGEFLLLEMLAFRYGYYREKIDDHGFRSNKNLLEEKTSGFGFQIPLTKIKYIPVDIEFNMVKLPQPSYVKNVQWKDFSLYNLNFRWRR